MSVVVDQRLVSKEGGVLIDIMIAACCACSDVVIRYGRAEMAIADLC